MAEWTRLLVCMKKTGICLGICLEAYARHKTGICLIKEAYWRKNVCRGWVLNPRF